MARREGARRVNPSPPRVVVPGAALVAGAEVPFGAEEVRHARSRRLSDGDAVVLLDGAGGRAAGLLTGGGTAARVVALLPGRGEPTVRLTVALAAAEPARVEWAIEKGTECGAAAFLLFVAERSQSAHVRALSARLERLRRIAAEAAKQCDRSSVPPVEGPFDLPTAIGALPAPLLFALPGARRLDPAAFAAGGAGTLLVGPEGGLAPPEADALEAGGGVAAGLGPRVLRLETAVVAALTLALSPLEPGEG